jgi:glycosyl-4,4'-diaponeurosporenoate acyltransferase
MRAAPAVLVDAAVWATSGAAVGWSARRLPSSYLATDNRLTRLRDWERSGRCYERLGVRRWKAHLPDAGRWFGGPPNRQLPGRGRDSLVAFAREARRAELVHWAAPLPVLAFPLWNPWPITAAMVVYALAANVPCLLVQRYNRARIARMVPC